MTNRSSGLRARGLAFDGTEESALAIVDMLTPSTAAWFAADQRLEVVIHGGHRAGVGAGEWVVFDDEHGSAQVMSGDQLDARFEAAAASPS